MWISPDPRSIFILWRAPLALHTSGLRGHWRQRRDDRRQKASDLASHGRSVCLTCQACRLTCQACCLTCQACRLTCQACCLTCQACRLTCRACCLTCQACCHAAPRPAGGACLHTAHPLYPPLCTLLLELPARLLRILLRLLLSLPPRNLLHQLLLIVEALLESVLGLAPLFHKTDHAEDIVPGAIVERAEREEA